MAAAFPFDSQAPLKSEDEPQVGQKRTRFAEQTTNLETDSVHEVNGAHRGGESLCGLSKLRHANGLNGPDFQELHRRKCQKKNNVVRDQKPARRARELYDILKDEWVEWGAVQAKSDAAEAAQRAAEAAQRAAEAAQHTAEANLAQTCEQLLRAQFDLKQVQSDLKQAQSQLAQAKFDAIPNIERVKVAQTLFKCLGDHTLPWGARGQAMDNFMAGMRHWDVMDADTQDASPQPAAAAAEEVSESLPETLPPEEEDKIEQYSNCGGSKSDVEEEAPPLTRTDSMLTFSGDATPVDDLSQTQPWVGNDMVDKQ